MYMYGILVEEKNSVIFHYLLVEKIISEEFTKTLRKVCTCQKLTYAFLLLEYCKIRECYAVANAFSTRGLGLRKVDLIKS
jgi:hypothetical protein